MSDRVRLCHQSCSSAGHLDGRSLSALLPPPPSLSLPTSDRLSSMVEILMLDIPTTFQAGSFLPAMRVADADLYHLIAVSIAITLAASHNVTGKQNPPVSLSLTHIQLIRVRSGVVLQQFNLDINFDITFG